MVLSARGTTMPRPIPVPVRRAILRLWQRGQTTGQIAVALGVPPSTVRRLVARFRRWGPGAIAPDYHRPPAAAAPSGAVQAALRCRREHPTWGAGLIRVQLLQQMPGAPVPSVRALQRAFAAAGLIRRERGA